MTEPLGQGPIQEPHDKSVAKASDLALSKKYSSIASKALNRVDAIPKANYGTLSLNTSNSHTCEELRAIIQNPVNEYLASIDYNSFHFVISFLNFLEKLREEDPGIECVLAFQRFKPDSSDEIVQRHGSSCVGQSTALVDRLERLNVKAFVAAEAEGPNGQVHHAATVVPCSDGIILIEIYMPKDPLIILKPTMDSELHIGNERFNTNFKLIETPGNYATKEMMISKTLIGVEEGDKEGTGEWVTVQQNQFLLRPIYNPEQTVMKHFLMNELNYVASAPPVGTKQEVVQVNYQTKEVTFQLGRGRDSKRYILDFSAFDWENKQIDFTKVSKQQQKVKIAVAEQKALIESLVDGSFFKAFKTENILDQIFIMVQHHKTMSTLPALLKE